MKGQANTVALIIIIAIILIGGAFYLGTHWGAPAPVATGNPVATTTTGTTGATTGSDYYTDTSTWQADADTTAGFSIKYPIDFDAQANTSPMPTTDWRLNSQDSGNLSFTLTIPPAFEPQTNFADAKLTVGESSAAAAVAACLKPDASGGAATMTTAIVNGITFTVFTSSDAGAGNLYDTTSYRAVHNGKCYAVEYTIHSSQLANYPASYNLTQFDEAKVKDVLDRVVGTFTFL